MYTVFLQNSGKVEATIVDEKVPIENNRDNLFVLEPKNHSNARQAAEIPKPAKFGSPRQKATAETEVEIWPQLLAKAMAKNLGSYERLFNQEMANSLSDLTGMPVKTLPIENIEYRWLRQNYKQGSVVICKAKPSWISQRKRDASTLPADKDIEHWIVSQVIALSGTEQMVELKNHFCDKPPKMGTISLL
jgi:hypothetical protein